MSADAQSAPGPGLSVVVVTHDSAAEIGRSLPALLAELRHGDELIVCDNDSSDETCALVAGLAGPVTLLPQGGNLGFGAACNAGARAASNELLLFLNPDATVAPGFRDAIELPLLEGSGWAAWQGLVTAEGGTVVNTWGGVVHFSGIAWAGGAGRPIGEAPGRPREVAFASGACLAVRADAFRHAGGFSEPFFLYHEDVEFSLRLRRLGERVGIEPRAICEHEYEFEKGPHKWRFMERNRWATILRTYPGALLAALLPALVVTNLALYLVALVGGWLPQKLAADLEGLRWTPRLLRERSSIGAAARLGRAEPGAGAFAAPLSADLDSAYLGRAAGSPLLAGGLRLYWRAVLALLGGRGR